MREVAVAALGSRAQSHKVILSDNDLERLAGIFGGLPG
jgi:hypothetical protein